MNKLIIAHRGGASLARENTLEAFEKAIDLRADMIEFDVRRTRDQRYVIHHDPRIAGKYLNELTCIEVREIARAMGFHVPELEEALQLVRGRIGLNRVEGRRLRAEGSGSNLRGPAGRGLYRQLLPCGLDIEGQATPSGCTHRFHFQGCKGPDGGHPGGRYRLDAPGSKYGRGCTARAHAPGGEKDCRLDRERHKTDDAAPGGRPG